MGASSGEITLPCPDLGKALAFFTGELGLRLDAIFPADDPRQAELSGHGVRIRLRREPEPAREADGGWIEGRAGMRYRDLVPDRDGGRLIASRIQLTDAGPVPDHVHFHDVCFQLIYCHHGWVRVVLSGGLTLRDAEAHELWLTAVEAKLLPPDRGWTPIDATDDLELLAVVLPTEAPAVPR